MRPDDRCRPNAVSNQKTWAGRAPLRRVLGVRPARAGCRAVRDSTLVAWYRFVYAPRAGGADDSHHPAGGIAGPTPRPRSVAARGARTAAGVASDPTAKGYEPNVGAFHRGLRDIGYIEGLAYLGGPKAQAAALAELKNKGLRQLECE